MKGNKNGRKWKNLIWEYDIVDSMFICKEKEKRMPRIFHYSRCLLRIASYFSMTCFFLTAWFSPVFASGGILKIHFIDVGYGDAILIEPPYGEAALIDAGQSQCASRLETYLSDQGIENFKTVILTHPHEDHFGGFFSVLKKWPVGKFYINGDTKRAEEGYDDLIKIIEGRQIPVTLLREGDDLPFAGTDFRILVLHPSALERPANENALVLWIVFKETSFLLTSDIQNLQQDEILECYPQVKSAHVIQVPHHGGTITDQFANSFENDSIFVVSTGANEYGRPFIEELEKLKGKVLRTDLHGPIVLQSDGYQVEVINEGY